MLTTPGTMAGLGLGQVLGGLRSMSFFVCVSMSVYVRARVLTGTHIGTRLLAIGLCTWPLIKEAYLGHNHA